MEPIRCAVCDESIAPVPGQLEQCHYTHVLAWDFRCECGMYRRIEPNRQDTRPRNNFTGELVGANSPA